MLEDRRLLTVAVATLHSFSSPANAWENPAAGLTLVGSTWFGMTAQDGSDGDGTLFSMNLDGSNYQILHTFTGTTADGANPYAGLTLVGSTLYGTTSEGGSSGDGTVFSFDTGDGNFQLLHSFGHDGSDGQNPYSSLTLDGSTFYGTTLNGGGSSSGTVFSIDTDGSDFQTVYSFGDTSNDGYAPEASLTLDGETLFGTTVEGGIGEGGTVFSVNTNGSDYRILYSFQNTGNDAKYPYAGLTLVGSTLFGTTESGGSNDSGTVFSIDADGSDYQIVYSFGASENDGFYPDSGLTLVGSTLIGTTLSGGNNGSGTVFSIGSTIGAAGVDYQSLYSFGATDPAAQGPASDLTLVGSTLFGVSLQGGSDGDGTVFSISGLVPDLTVTPSNRAASYSLGGSAVQVDSGLAVNSTVVNSSTAGTPITGSAAYLTGASVAISAGTLQSGDTLHFTHQNGINGVCSGGTLILSGSATPAQYQAALESVTFSTTSTSTATRAISVVAAVGSAYISNVAPESVVVLPTAPVATASGVTNTYFLDTYGTSVDSGLTITSDDADLTGARMEISADTLKQFDMLDFATQNGISGTYSDGTLILSGNATVAQYQAALQSVIFWTLDNSTTSRSISITVFDGAATSNVVPETLDVSLLPPSISTSGTINIFTVGGAPVAVDAFVAVYDDHTDLAGTTVTISPDTLQPGDMLNFTSQDGIIGNYSDGVLSLSGDATPDQYSAVLQSVTFSTTSTNTVERSISIVASDGTLESEPAQESVDVAVYTPMAMLNFFNSTANEMWHPVAGLTLVGSTLFGMTSEEGSDGDGIIFSMNPNGSNYQIVHTFTGSATDGADPLAGLTLVGSTLYGTTNAGGSNDAGTVFSINTDGSDFQVLHSFVYDGVDGQNPAAGLTLDGSTLLGTTENGGSGYEGTIFSINTDGDDYQVLHSFMGSPEGEFPQSALVLAGTTVFGTATWSGSGGGGTLFSMNVSGSGFQILHSFHDTDDDGEIPYTGLTLVGSTLFGVTTDGGSNNSGALFSVNTDGSDYRILHAFGASDQDGVSPFAGLTLVGSTLYGTTMFGGSNSGGTIFSINPDGSDYQIQYSFGATDDDGQEPVSSLTLVGSTLDGITLAGGYAGDGEIFSLSGATPNFMVTASSGSPAYAVGGPAVAVDSGITVTASDADLTGATVTISPDTLQSGDLLNFVDQNGISGSYSAGELILSGSATPAQYQAALQSVTFTSTSTNTTTRSISIVALDGELDSNTAAEQLVIDAPVVTRSGTTNTYLVGGVAAAVDSLVAVGYDQTDLTGATVTISSDTLQSGDTLNFTNQNGISGSYSAGLLTLSGPGSVADYQTALQSVTFSSTSTSTTARSISIVASDGVLDSIAASESVTVAIAVPLLAVPFQTVYAFGNTFAPGANPQADLTAVGSTLFGTAESWGSARDGTIFSVNADGSGFHVLHAFTGAGTDGANPVAGLTLVGSTLFGTTEYGGSDGDGTVFSINTDGTGYRVLYSFTGTGADGANPVADLTLAGSTLFGTTESGGNDNEGTVFSIHTDGTGYSVVHSFINNHTDGTIPFAGLTLVGSTLYGTTEGGGTSGDGTLFSIHADGSGYQILHSFIFSVGAYPESDLTLVGSTLFGTTYGGGTDFDGTIYSFDTSDDSYHMVHSFSGNDGRLPVAGLTLVGSTLFGTTLVGGSDNGGVVFSINTDGSTFQVLHAFNYPNDGALVYGGLTLVGSSLFGTTNIPYGSIYSISDINNYTVGGPAIAVNPGVTLTLASSTTDIDGATVTISPSTLQSGDTLHFTTQSGISGSYANGTLTLSGSATPAQYQVAIESVTFSSTSSSSTSRVISTTTFDADGSQASDTVFEQVNVAAPARVTAVFVKGSAWSPVFNSYLATQGVGNATQGYQLISGTSELTKPLPWVNINTISIQFSELVNVAGGITVAQDSLELLGGSGSGITAPPAIASFSVSGNVATWVLSGPLTNNQYVIGVASTMSSFGTPVTDANGAGLDGEYTKSVTNLPSGNGLAGGTFDFWFNVLPGDSNQSGTVSSADSAAVSAELGKNTRSAAGTYSIFADLDGSSVIAAADVNDASATLGKALNRTAPSTPSDVQVGATDFTALALGVQETGSSQPASTQAAGSQGSGFQTSSTSTAGVSTTTLASTVSETSGSSTANSTTGSTTTASTATQNQATDAAVSDFDLADLYA